jgi:5-methylcytosine-specific restriction endonuclease McrA
VKLSVVDAASPAQAGEASLSALALCEPPPMPEPGTPAELRALVHAGLNESDACEWMLAQHARLEGALDLAIGAGLAALQVGDRLISLGFSGLRDYAREILDVEERTAQAIAHFSRELRSRPLLRAAVRAGEVRPRNAQVVLPVAVGEAEAEWVKRARVDTVRALEKAVRAAQPGADEDDEWTRFRVRLSPEERATVDEALAIAGPLMPGSKRPQQLEAMAQEYLGEHPTEAGDDGAGPVGGAFLSLADALEQRKARLEVETERWSHLDAVARVVVPDADCDVFEAMTSATEIDARLKDLAAVRQRWDTLLGYCAYVVRRSGLWKLAGFVSFDHYATERLGLGGRTVEQRAALEKLLWEVPALRAARDAGLAYEKLRLLSRLPYEEVERWVPRARKVTCVALRAALEDRDEGQMRAARVLRARVPVRVALLLQAAFRAVRAVEGRLLYDGTCLVRVARHFIETWESHVKEARTRSQKVRERDLGRCQAPGCSRRAVHAHHIIPRSHGGSDEPENLVGICACHHLRGIHGGYIRVSGRAPDQLVWEVRGRVWRDGDFGSAEATAS